MSKTLVDAPPQQARAPGAAKQMAGPQRATDPQEWSPYGRHNLWASDGTSGLGRPSPARPLANTADAWRREWLPAPHASKSLPSQLIPNFAHVGIVQRTAATLPAMAIQRLRAAADSAPTALHRTAASGTTNTARALPHFHRTQRARAPQDRSGPRALIGSPAAQTNRDTDATAYAVGRAGDRHEHHPIRVAVRLAAKKNIQRVSDPEEETFTVPKGWGVNQIARHLKTTVQEIKDANRGKLKSWNGVEGFLAGEKISVPDPGVDTSGGEDPSLVYGMKVSSEFRRKVAEVASSLGANADHLMAIMAFETGGSFSPSQKNMAGSGATGLIQFMPNTAKLLGTTTEKLAEMAAVRQLEYVRKYFQPYKGKLKSIDDFYMAVLWPAAVGKDPGFVLFRAGGKAYQQNRGLDSDGDGKITKEEASARVRKHLDLGEKLRNTVLGAEGRGVENEISDAKEGGSSEPGDGNVKDLFKAKTKGGLNVRRGPGVTYGLAREPLQKGAEVAVFEENGGWCRIGDGEWISGSPGYIERIAPNVLKQDNHNQQDPQQSIDPKPAITTDELEKGVAMLADSKYHAGHAYIAFTGKSGTKYEPGDKISDQDARAFYGARPTWCNQFAFDFIRSITDTDPFAGLNQYNTTAGEQFAFMQKSSKLFQPLSSFEDAWKEINAGRLVLFSTSDHISIGYPTPAAELESRTVNGTTYKFGKVIQAGASHGIMYLNRAWKLERFPGIKIFEYKGH